MLSDLITTANQAGRQVHVVQQDKANMLSIYMLKHNICKPLQSKNKSQHEHASREQNVKRDKVECNKQPHASLEKHHE